VCGWEPRDPTGKPVTGAAVCAWRGVWVPRLSPAAGDAVGRARLTAGYAVPWDFL